MTIKVATEAGVKMLYFPYDVSPDELSISDIVISH